MPHSETQITNSDALKKLKTHWGFSEFRPGQWEAIEAVLGGKDVLAVLPTGGGKSLLYQLPALLLDGVVLVVSPLIALMHDQVSSLKRRGIPAAAITSFQSRREIDQTWTDAEYGRYKLLYVTPERLQSEIFLARVDRFSISLLAVDEAHCISEWGHDFRPAYRKIAETRGILSNLHENPSPVLSVTATATPEVRRDIIEQLELSDPTTLVHGFDRPNIVWSVFREQNKQAKVDEILTAVPGSSIVYAGTRKAASQWASNLREKGISAEAYHAGLTDDERKTVQAHWQDGTTRVVVATSAFGMGIDKADVRTVIHVALPATLESYYQEAGRAGRDNHRAHAVLIVSSGDDALPRSFVEQGHPDEIDVQKVYDAVCNAGQIPVGDHPDEPLVATVENLAALSDVSQRAVKASMDYLEKQGILSMLSEEGQSVLVRMRIPRDQVLQTVEKIEDAGDALVEFVESVLRRIPVRAHSSWITVDMEDLENQTALPRKRVLSGMEYLSQRGILTFHQPGEGIRIVLSEPRVAKLAIDKSQLLQGRKRALKSLQEMIRYTSMLTCRRQFLLTYFGEKTASRCGSCDVCLGRHRPELVTPEDEPVLQRLLDEIDSGLPRKSWVADMGLPTYRRDGLVDWLVEEGYVSVDNPLTDVYSLTPKAVRKKKGVEDT
ncbi:MAG: RecQ family ATP-dependent DNA helicase [Rubricoccaceae bacterium]|nr:RecQ family ATP-dependent DNA helicase [Rubricoccaceae bacterium]